MCHDACRVPRWHVNRGIFCEAPVYAINENGEAINIGGHGGTRP
jgi:hypothetical protein